MDSARTHVHATPVVKGCIRGERTDKDSVARYVFFGQRSSAWGAMRNDNHL